MNIKTLSARVEKLETMQQSGSIVNHLVTVNVGESEDEARSRYEQEQRPIAPGDGIIFASFVRPPTGM